MILIRVVPLMVEELIDVSIVEKSGLSVCRGDKRIIAYNDKATNLLILALI